jgi:hypothetical protein
MHDCGFRTFDKVRPVTIADEQRFEVPQILGEDA